MGDIPARVGGVSSHKRNCIRSCAHDHLVGGGFKACYFTKHDFALGVKGEGQDASRNFARGFGSMHAMLPM